jgi:hypothetical protein
MLLYAGHAARPDNGFGCHPDQTILDGWQTGYFIALKMFFIGDRGWEGAFGTDKRILSYDAYDCFYGRHFSAFTGRTIRIPG